MWELPTPLIAANKPSRENEVRELPAQPPRYTGTTRSSLNIASWYSQFNRTCIASKTGLDSNMSVCNATADIITQAQDLNLPQQARREIRRLCQQTTQGRCLRTPHQLQANVRKQYPNEASQQEESNATTLALVGAVYRRQSKKIRNRKQLHRQLKLSQLISAHKPDLATDLTKPKQRSLLTQTTSQRTTVATGHLSSLTEFTRKDLITALNEMVQEYRKLSQTFKEVKAENVDLKNSSVEPRSVQLGKTDSLQIELSKMKTENKPANDRIGLGFNAGESSTQSYLVYDKFKNMSFVKASMTHDTCE
ncbi:hypothetical protein F511_27435 [Dorcoceras hygrometricum]|uniref:Uncharacterized protein n=1 Tax=Dorcoceras hygrometricum TaxID=472368 RepID=A0A2Z7AW41_9LAMI|nr:hypothetical protein F511_27435 [Dorcoceras hygrometricum]